MSFRDRDPDQILDQIIDEIRLEQTEETEVRKMAERVWTRLTSGELLVPAVDPAPEAEKIRNCTDLQSWIPGYLEGTLPDSRRLLLEDHLRECVPCRRALRAAREGERRRARPEVREVAFSGWKMAGWALAATVLLAVLVTQFGVIDRFLPAPPGARAVVASIEGTLFRVSPEGTVELATGGEIREGEEIRTAKDSGALLTLRDGSRVELNQRAELSISESRAGRVINLNRGSIIVEAAPQKKGFLSVSTEECLVSVRGTVFSVSHGVKGSRVSVIEGEVSVQHGRTSETLIAGQQISTRRRLAPVPVEQEIAWSHDAGRHIALLREITSLQKDLEAALSTPLNTSATLLDLLPEGTVIYLSIPNLTAGLEEAHLLFQEKLAQSPVLQEWWSQSGAEIQPQLEEALQRLRAFGSYLGEEVVVGVKQDEQGEMAEPVILAQITDEAQFRSILEAETSRINEEIAQEQGLQLIDDPLALAQNPGGGLYLWVHDGLFAASPSLLALQEVALIRQTTGSGFSGIPFYERIAQAYQEGVGYLLAVDMERLLKKELSRPRDPAEQEAIQQLGVLDMRHLIVERKGSGDQTETRATMSFEDSRRGFVSWLAEPAPMGALEFVSADAQLVAAFVVKEPTLMIEDLFGFLTKADPEAWNDLVEFQLREGINIQEDFAAPLGGEFVLALDGPILPTPAWKLVLEVYDPVRLQQTLEWAVTQLNQKLIEEGKPEVELLVQQSDGRTFYSLVSQDFGKEIHYLFVDGYLVAAPSRALLISAIQFRQTGYTLPSSERFTALLPADGKVNLSALLFQDFGTILSPLAERLPESLGNLDPESQSQLKEMASGMQPTLVYAYGGHDQITVAGTGSGLPGLSLAGWLGSGGQSGLFKLLEQGAAADLNQR